jgi:hypothetical protein
VCVVYGGESAGEDCGGPDGYDDVSCHLLLCGRWRCIPVRRIARRENARVQAILVL